MHFSIKVFEHPVLVDLIKSIVLGRNLEGRLVGTNLNKIADLISIYILDARGE